MLEKISESSQQHDVSLRFCVSCLKKFCPKTAQISSGTVRFFVPTVDAFSRNHFAYIELPQKIVDIIYHTEEHFSVDLTEIAEVLHVEIGDLPSATRKEEIKSFYSYSAEINVHFAHQITA